MGGSQTLRGHTDLLSVRQWGVFLGFPFVQWLRGIGCRPRHKLSQPCSFAGGFKLPGEVLPCPTQGLFFVSSKFDSNLTLGGLIQKIYSFRCELIIALLSFFCSLVSFDSLAVVACGWCRFWPAVRLFGRATRLFFGGACASCGAAVRALRFLSGRPLRTPSRVALSFAGRSQYKHLWPRVAIKTKSVITIHTYRCRQSYHDRHSVAD